jgi:hypothetical protein
MFTCRPVNVGERKVSSIIIDRTRTVNLSLTGRRGTDIFLFCTVSGPALRSGVLFPVPKWPGRESNHSHHMAK